MTNSPDKTQSAESLENRAKAVIAKCRESAYGPGDWANDLEGDFGTWDDWRSELIQFAQSEIKRQTPAIIAQAFNELEKELSIAPAPVRAGAIQAMQVVKNRLTAPAVSEGNE